MAEACPENLQLELWLPDRLVWPTWAAFRTSAAEPAETSPDSRTGRQTTGRRREVPVFPLRRSDSRFPARDGVVSARAEWMAAAEATRRQPGAFDHAVHRDGIPRVVGTRGQKPTGAGEHRRQQQLVQAEQQQGSTLSGRQGFAGLTGISHVFAGAVARQRAEGTWQSRSRGWRRRHRTAHGAESPRCRRPARQAERGSCEKSHGSTASRGSGERRPRAFATRRSLLSLGWFHSPPQPSSDSGPDSGSRSRRRVGTRNGVEAGCRQ